MKRSLIIFAALLLALALTSCGDNSNVSLRLTPAERGRIDTLYTAQLDSLRPLWDSMCTQRYDMAVSKAVDSIVQQRMEEEIRLRSRLTD